MGTFSSLLCQSSEDTIQDHCDGSPPCSLKIQAPSFFQICGPLEVSLVPQPKKTFQPSDPCSKQLDGGRDKKEEKGTLELFVEEGSEGALQHFHLQRLARP